MTEVNYPAVVHAPHFALLSRTKKGPVPLSDRLYRSRDDAESWANVLREPGERVSIAECSVAFYARCVVCGEFSDRERWRTAEWPDLVQYLTHEPGWRCTAEQLVFCPNHRPDEED